jgi:glycosyltransferase involved in cell wall biosynthesis
MSFSIIIICKNEEENIERCIQSIASLSDDIVVYDSGSTDETLEKLKNFPIKLFTGGWEGFGKTRQKAAELSKYDWVLIIDADEVVSQNLGLELLSLSLTDSGIAYRIHLKNHLGNKHIKWGVWGNDDRIRLYNKNMVHWNEDIVHEKLVMPRNIVLKKLHSTIHHYTAKNFEQLSQKMKQYALLTAEKYYSQGKKAVWINKNFSPLFTFIKSYVFKLGFLDGGNGFKLAKIIALYTSLKYKRLHELWT